MNATMKTTIKLIAALILVVVIFLLPTQNVNAELPVGKVPPTITLDGDDGGKISGEKWSSTEITGKVFCLMYVDPDEKDINAHVEKAMKAENFSKEKFASIAMINLGATWKPNFIIDSILEGKQKDFPKTIYVRDVNEKVSEIWNLSTDNYCIVLFNKNGEVLMSKDGKFSDNDTNKLLKLIKDNL